MRGTVCYATEQGLGRLAKSFIDNGIIDKILIVPHSKHKTMDWYGDKGRPFLKENYEWFLLDLDEIIFFEIPFDWNLVLLARDLGIKTSLMPDECTTYPLRYEFDRILCPTLLENTYNLDKKCLNITVPVDVEWKLREKAVNFIHNAGHGGLGGRNGTNELIQAMKYVKSPIKLTIRTQTNEYKTDDPRVNIVQGTIPFEDLYKEGDVFIFPDKFAGLSLPMQEAFSAGMLVMSTNRFPTNTWLPLEPLIDVYDTRIDKIGIEFEYSIIRPIDIASKIDEWYNSDISNYSLMGKEWSIKNTWSKLNELLLQG